MQTRDADARQGERHQSPEKTGPVGGQRDGHAEDVEHAVEGIELDPESKSRDGDRQFEQGRAARDAVMVTLGREGARVPMVYEVRARLRAIQEREDQGVEE
jgi:hypothetical protein